MTTKSDGDTLTKAKEQPRAPAAESNASRATNQRSKSMSVQETFEAPAYRPRLAAKPVANRRAKPSRTQKSTPSGWPDRYDTIEKWREIAPHFTDKECASMAAKTRQRIANDAPRYAELVEKMRGVGIPQIADHAQAACDHGYPFNTYLENMLASAPPEPTRPWDVALGNYKDAVQTMTEVTIRDRASYAATFAEAPAELVRPALHYAIHWRWVAVNCLNDDIGLTTAKRDELRPLLAAALARRDERDKDDGSEGEQEKASDAVFAAFDALMAVAAPDAEALAIKAGLAAKEHDGAGLGYDDLGLVCFLQNGDIGEAAQVQNYRDLLTIAGMDHPILHMPSFDPRAWLRDHEAKGGKVAAGLWETYFIHPDDDGGDAEAMVRELVLTPWKARAVDFEARHRKSTGGDPVYWADGQLRAPRQLHGAAFDRADRITFAGNPAGGTPLVIVEPVDNRVEAHDR